MLRSGPAARLTIHLPANALWHQKPVYAEIVHRAHQAGLAGASVLHGIQGYGAHLHIREDHPSRLMAHGPCAVVIVDDEERIRAFLADLGDVLTVTGVALVDRVEVYWPGSR